MRLIDAQEYVKELKKEIDWPHRSLEFIGAIEVALADLRDMPTISPESLRPKGRWEVNKEYGDYECSVCKSGDITALHFSQLRMNYCPNCGAKMEE